MGVCCLILPFGLGIATGTGHPSKGFCFGNCPVIFRSRLSGRYGALWVKVDDHFDEHPKFAEVGPLGIALWLTGLAYCNRNLTDGHIPWAKARSLLNWEFLGANEGNERGRKIYTIGVSSGMQGEDVTCAFVIDLLLASGLWEPDDRGGYYVHDYPTYQPLKDQVMEDRDHIRSVRSQAGQASAEARKIKYGSAQPNKPEQMPEQTAEQGHEQIPNNIQSKSPESRNTSGARGRNHENQTIQPNKPEQAVEQLPNPVPVPVPESLKVKDAGCAPATCVTPIRSPETTSASDVAAIQALIKEFSGVIGDQETVELAVYRCRQFDYPPAEIRLGMLQIRQAKTPVSNLVSYLPGVLKGIRRDQNGHSEPAPKVTPSRKTKYVEIPPGLEVHD